MYLPSATVQTATNRRVPLVEVQLALLRGSFIAYTAFMSTIEVAAPQPDERTVSMAGAVLPRLREYLAEHTDEVVRLRAVDDQDTLDLPREAVELFTRILAHLAVGQGVTIVPTHAELTTQQAADLMNVSRPYLIKLLDNHEIEFRKVGKHRRIPAEALLRYLAEDDDKRRAAATELTRLSRELDI